MNLRLIKGRANNFNINIKRYLNGKYLFAWLDEIIAFLFFGSSPDDYFRYEFYKKSYSERNKFITYGRCQKIIKKNNDESYRKYLDDKAEFNKFFADYIDREWLDLRTATKEDFELFIKKHKEVIIKPARGGKGITYLR